jgi:hypothetical protein
MRPLLPNFSHAHLPEGGWGLAFQAVNSVCLAVVTSKLLIDMLRDHNEAKHKAQANAEQLGPMVRREVERALAAHSARRGRGE